MRYVELGTTGQRVSQLALGCMQMGAVTDEASSVEMLDRFVAAGGTFLDTADCYMWWSRKGSAGGESEELLGRWLARTGRRDEMFIATKGSAMPRDPASLWPEHGEPDWALARKRFAGAGASTLRDALDGSLRRLGVDHVDLYYVHVDDLATPLEETLEALAGFVTAGKVRYLGWSNVRTWRLERIRQLCAQNGWPAPVALQQEHSYLRTRAGFDTPSIVQPEQLHYLRHNPEVSLVAYSPILKGIYDDPKKREGHYAMAPYTGPDSEARLTALTEVAAELKVAPNQLVIAWLLHQSSPTVIPLVGPKTLEQYHVALGALDVQLTPDQLERLAAAGA